MAEIEGGYIKVYRKMTKWRWYSDEVMFRVFMHLLLTANYEPAYWRDIKIDRGQTVISVNKLAATLNYSKATVHNALKRLESTGEITRAPNARYTIVTLKNYNEYQENRTVNERQPNDSRTIAERRLYPLKEVKKNKEEQEEKEGKGETRSAPPPTQPTEQSLIALYGIEATERYKKKFERWCTKKNKQGIDCISTIAKWMEQDGVTPLTVRDSNSSIDIAKIDRQILAFYDDERSTSDEDKQTYQNFKPSNW